MMCLSAENDLNSKNSNLKYMNKQIAFENIADELIELYKAKNKAYGNSFGETYAKLGIISAITRISDKHNRLVNLATNKDIDNLGESIEDTLRDMANYCIMTLVELRCEKENESALSNLHKYSNIGSNEN
jgi:hypothetical protein